MISMQRVDASTIKVFTGVRLHLTLTNQGTKKAAATTLRYYRSSDATLSSEDDELRVVSVSELGAGKSSTTWALLPGATSTGVYYYGACLDGVASEVDTSNNCSDAIEITVISPHDDTATLKPTGTIPEQELEVGDSPVVLDMSQYFVGKVENWTASSTKTDVITVSMSDAEVTLTPVGEGWTTVAITASRDDLAAKQTFIVSIGDVDVPVVKPIGTVPPLSIEVGDPPVPIKPWLYFVFALGQIDRWSGTSDKPSVVEVLPWHSNFPFSLKAVSAGQATVTIEATYGDLVAKQTFTVSVTDSLDPNAPDLSPEVSIPDENLRTKVSETLGLEEDDPITQQKMRGLTSLLATFSEITDLTGLEHATRLRILHLDHNQISDLTPLQNLTSLTTLHLTYNEQISDLTPLQNLTNLEELWISADNQISDLTPLQNLTDLRHLGIGPGQYSDLTPLQNLTNLTNLGLRSSQLTDITPIQNLTNLSVLSFRLNSQLSDITPVQNLTNLTYFDAKWCSISDVSPLENLIKLETLRLGGNPIEDLAPLRRLKEKNPNIDIDINVGAAPSAPLLPAETALLSNYPNPFNPETWIPYQLAKATDVTLTIYDVRGVIVRQLALGHRPAGFYYSRGRAAHWDGRNELGEKVASGLYFYTFTAGEFTATKKLLIRK